MFLDYTEEQVMLKKAVHQGTDTGFRHSLSIEMEQSIHCFDDATTHRALQEYTKFIQEKVEVPKEQRATITEVVKHLQSDRFLRKIHE